MGTRLDRSVGEWIGFERGSRWIPFLAHQFQVGMDLVPSSIGGCSGIPTLSSPLLVYMIVYLQSIPGPLTPWGVQLSLLRSRDVH